MTINEFFRIKSASARVETVKRLGRSHIDKKDPLLRRIIKEDPSSMVKREAVSSLGRGRNPENISLFIDLLSHSDPKIVMQAARALLPFKGSNDVGISIKSLVNHPNEMVSESIRKILNPTKNNNIENNTTEDLRNLVINGDTVKLMRLMPGASIDLTFTSPPYYNARDYSTYSSYDDYLDTLEEVFKEIHRITKEGRFFVINTSPIIIPRLSRAHSSKRYPIPFDIHSRLVSNGWEFIDDIVWEKPEYSVKNRVGGFHQHRKPLGYKPNSVTEYIMVYRKRTDKLLDWNMKQYDKLTIANSLVKGKYETTNIWKISPKYSLNHSAVFPEQLCDNVIKYYSYKGDLVFDPFAGSGTLGLSATKLGRNFIMTEIDIEYYDHMRAKLKDITGVRFLNINAIEKSK